MTTVGRYSPNKVRARVLDGTWPEPIGGMALIKPTSVVTAGAGSGATIGINGSVSFTSCTSLSLNGVFSADYDNYMVTMRGTQSSLWALRIRLRNAGTDNSTANSYTQQYIFADSSSVTAGRSATDFGSFGWLGETATSGNTMSLYGPYLSQPTAMRVVSASNEDSATIVDYAQTHNQSASYDGFTLLTETSRTITGLVSVYGLVGA